MYTCTVAPNIHHFKKPYSTGLELYDLDYIDIYKAQSTGKISELLCKITEGS